MVQILESGNVSHDFSQYYLVARRQQGKHHTMRDFEGQPQKAMFSSIILILEYHGLLTESNHRQSPLPQAVPCSRQHLSALEEQDCPCGAQGAGQALQTSLDSVSHCSPSIPEKRHPGEQFRCQNFQQCKLINGDTTHKDLQIVQFYKANPLAILITPYNF